MTSLRRAIRKYGSTARPASLRALARQTGLAPPVSVRQLERRLDPEELVLKSGALGPSTTTGRAELALQSNGFWSYRGRVRESGLVGHNYLFAVALDVQDPSGKVITFVNEGNVKGTTTPGSSDDEWQQNGHSAFIADQWDTVKRTRADFRLRVSTDPFQVVTTVLAGLFVGAAAVGYAVFVSDPKTKCEWGPFQDDQGGGGIEVRCRREFE